MPNTVRVTFTLPADTATAIVAIARRLRITRSALMAQLLTDPVAELQKLVDLIPEGSKPGDKVDARRLRRGSVELIQRVVNEALEVASDLDGNPDLL